MAGKQIKLVTLVVEVDEDVDVEELAIQVGAVAEVRAVVDVQEQEGE